MKDKGKYVKSEQDNPNFLSNHNIFQPSSDLPCRKHPSNSSSVGICAFCLNEKLIELACSDCGEPRLSSCSLDVGSVGRVSFFINNNINNNNNNDNDNDNNVDEAKTLFSNVKLKQSEAGDVVLLRRSNSCVVGVKKDKGFWRIGKLFNKKREKQEFSIACSSAKISNFNECESKKSGLMDLRSGIVGKESNFSGIDNENDNDEFIDLKIDLSNKSKTEDSVLKECDPLGGDVGALSGRVMVNEEGIKKVKNSHVKGWKWIFKNHYGKNDFDHIFDS